MIYVKATIKMINVKIVKDKFVIYANRFVIFVVLIIVKYAKI